MKHATNHIQTRCVSAKKRHRTDRNNKTNKMKSKIFTLMFVCFTSFSFAQSQTNQNSTIQRKQVSENATYQLFPTQNYWTFIKLDTRNGKMWQVHFTVEEDGTDGELILNSTPLVNGEKEVNGRFTLYPTENMYNFLLLDQIDGLVIQVQWSLDTKKRGIVSIINPIEG